MNPTKTQIFLFDFDGTLTTRDTLLAFIRFAKGRWKLLGTLVLHLPLLLLMKLHLYPNGRMKERIFGFLFKDMREEDFDNICRAFARSHRFLLRPKGIKRINDALNEGAEVLIISASIDHWVRPFFEELPEVRVIGTQIEVKNGRLTGRFHGKNCYGAEKVRRVASLLNQRKKYELTAYGDSRGDKELLAYADKGFFRAFE